MFFVELDSFKEYQPRIVYDGLPLEFAAASFKIIRGNVQHGGACNPSTQEAETGGLLRVPGNLISETHQINKKSKN